MSFVGTFFMLVLLVGGGELYLLVRASGQIGFGATLALCVLTGIVGGTLVRAQGLRTLQEIQSALGRGEVPTVQIVSGLVLLIVGAMLILPGFLTDALGFAMLVPPLRRAVARRLGKRFEGRLARHPPGGPFGTPRSRRPPGKVIDVDPDGGPKR